nr:Unknown Function [uncultured bacterium]
MSRLALCFAVIAASLIQIGVAPLFASSGIPLPLLPLGVLVGWAAARNAAETWPVLPLAAALLGVASTVTVGAYLLALLAGVSLVLLWPLAPKVPRALSGAALGAAAALVYLVAIMALGGRVNALRTAGGELAATALATAVLALGVVLVLQALMPARRSAQALFE